MKNDQLGKLAEDDAARDAIHIAIAPVVAAEVLWPGQRVGLDAEGKAATVAPPAVGIVDPFLTDRVYPGQSFWVCLFPNTITSLRHDWVHPAFSAAISGDLQGAALVWLRAFAVEAGISYEELMEAATAHLRDGEYLIDGGRFEHMRDRMYESETCAIFWRHYEAVTGARVAPDDRENFFSCSC